MAKRLYSDVVRVSSSGDESDQAISPTASPKPLVNWLKNYQKEEEYVALEKAINESKVYEEISVFLLYLKKKWYY